MSKEALEDLIESELALTAGGPVPRESLVRILTAVIEFVEEAIADAIEEIE
jgi:hypothetical protein